jgi:hypothetical protein
MKINEHYDLLDEVEEFDCEEDAEEDINDFYPEYIMIDGFLYKRKGGFTK